MAADLSTFHWPLYWALSNPVFDWVNRRHRGTSGSILFWISARLGHPLELWDQAIGCPKCGWNDLAAKHHMDIVAGHGHLIGSRRDISGKYTVIDSGGMFDGRRMDYINTVDGTNPMVNRGFVILTEGGELLLFDAENCDRDWWRSAAKRKRAA